MNLNDPNFDDSVITLLRDGEISLEGRLIDASNATLFGSIAASDEEKISLVYKPIAGERPLWDFPDGNLASRERAAYLVSVLGGFHCVPPTLLREGPFGLGAVQLWIDCDPEIDPIEIGQSDHRGIRNLALFDVIANNTDRKFGHILIDDEGRIFGCDHGVTFHQDDKLRTVLWQFADEDLTPDEVERITNLREILKAPTASELSELLTEVEREALILRIERLLAAGRFPLPSGEWPAVPWPPV